MDAGGGKKERTERAVVDMDDVLGDTPGREGEKDEADDQSSGKGSDPAKMEARSMGEGIAPTSRRGHRERIKKTRTATKNEGRGRRRGGEASHTSQRAGSATRESTCGDRSLSVLLLQSTRYLCVLWNLEKV